MYVYVCVCMYARVCTYLCTQGLCCCLYTYIHTLMHTYMHTCACRCLHVCMPLRACRSVSVRVCACLYACVLVSVSGEEGWRRAGGREYVSVCVCPRGPVLQDAGVAKVLQRCEAVTPTGVRIPCRMFHIMVLLWLLVNTPHSKQRAYMC